MFKKKENHIVVSNDCDKNWANDHLQFARLIAEMEATSGIVATPELCEAMDLDPKQIDEIVVRAQDAWGNVKERTSPYFCGHADD